MRLPGLTFSSRKVYKLQWIAKSNTSKPHSLQESFLSTQGSKMVAKDTLDDFLEDHCPTFDRITLSEKPSKTDEYLVLADQTEQSQNHFQSLARLIKSLHPRSVETLSIQHDQGRIINFASIQEKLAPYLEQFVPSHSNSSPKHQQRSPHNGKHRACNIKSQGKRIETAKPSLNADWLYL